jgi:hypothetical protein
MAARDKKEADMTTPSMNILKDRVTALEDQVSTLRGKVAELRGEIWAIFCFEVLMIVGFGVTVIAILARTHR